MRNHLIQSKDHTGGMVTNGRPPKIKGYVAEHLQGQEIYCEICNKCHTKYYKRWNRIDGEYLICGECKRRDRYMNKRNVKIYSERQAGRTLADIGKEYSLTKERIRQITSVVGSVCG